MRTQDAVNQNKNENKQPSCVLKKNVSEAEGLLNVTAHSEVDGALRREMQENHNGRHALWYLSMSVHAVLYGIPGWDSAQKVDRVIAHLAHLQEFILDSDLRFKVCVSRLLENVVIEYPDSYKKWAEFLYANWTLMRMFAERYKEECKCFSDESYLRLQDVVNGNYFMKFWWWSFQCKKTLRKWSITLRQPKRKQ